MKRHPMIYEIPVLKTHGTAFNGDGIIQCVGGGNLLIINELEQKQSIFAKNLLKNIKAACRFFLFPCILQPNNKQSLTLLTTIQKMRKTTKLKVLVLSLTMLACMLMPTSLLAQSAFTINASGDQVFFAPGNLRAVFAEANDPSCTWQFAPTQYSCVGEADANRVVGDNVVIIAGPVDLFGWVGASSAYEPYGINKNPYARNYGNIVNESLKSDWGVVANAANLGGHNNWRTLTADEWEYVFKKRTDADQKYAHCYVKYGDSYADEAYGMILLPDVWTLPDGLSFTPGDNSYFANMYTGEQWAQMEANGAVLLPTAGERNGTSVNNCSSSGYYWSSTADESDAGKAICVNISNKRLVPKAIRGKQYGQSVRLVRDAK